MLARVAAPGDTPCTGAACTGGLFPCPWPGFACTIILGSAFSIVFNQRYCVIYPHLSPCSPIPFLSIHSYLVGQAYCIHSVQRVTEQKRRNHLSQAPGIGGPCDLAGGSDHHLLGSAYASLGIVTNPSLNNLLVHRKCAPTSRVSR